MKVVLYARVSTLDKDQDPENQLLVLRRVAEAAGDVVVKEYVDQDSGRKSSRKAFQQLLTDAGKRKFDLVRVWDLSRFSREGIQAVFEHTSQLEQCGVSFWSYCEPMLNTAGPMKDFMKAVLSWAAGYYSERLSENVKQGLARKKLKAAEKGEAYVHGRRALAPELVARIRELQAEGLSVRKISAAVSVPVGTLHKYLVKEESPAK
ncbi:recombinase family protein [Hymenobacter metallicola]|uniref:Recombinase family protein n=1 Tax=Hymenobacter metallicola TaxID=2563114 RepID=A0A4Z0QDX5_9BACT|nr:recombinase family protein [Hymenobacter metallicola]TGE26892.1 recombinase family protein [Hymenobacter metallicola]